MVRGRQYNMTLAVEQSVRNGKVRLHAASTVVCVLLWIGQISVWPNLLRAADVCGGARLQLYEKTVYYVPPQITRGQPLDVLRWIAMSGATRANACTNKAGFVTLPSGGCTSSNQIANVSMATTRLMVQCAKVSRRVAVTPLALADSSHLLRPQCHHRHWLTPALAARRGTLSAHPIPPSAPSAPTATTPQAWTSPAARPASAAATPTLSPGALLRGDLCAHMTMRVLLGMWPDIPPPLSQARRVSALPQEQLRRSARHE